MSEMARLPGLCIIFQAFQAQSIKLLPNSNVRNKAYHISSIIIGIRIQCNCRAKLEVFFYYYIRVKNNL